MDKRGTQVGIGVVGRKGVAVVVVLVGGPHHEVIGISSDAIRPISQEIWHP